MAIKKVERTGKLDTQRWFFEAFAHQLNPEFCFCTYAGVELGRARCTSTLRLRPQGLRRGLLRVRTNRYSVRQDWWSLRRASSTSCHMFDRSFETMFGFVLRMPDATLYRWDAIKEDTKTQHSHSVSTFAQRKSRSKTGMTYYWCTATRRNACCSSR